MEELLTKVGTLGLNISSESAVQIAEIWYKAQIIDTIAGVTVFVFIFAVLGFMVWKINR